MVAQSPMPGARDKNARLKEKYNINNFITIKMRIFIDIKNT